jgi:UDP-2,4-diacetamido-2,4,6-trideoxy-beta-L-altropyranose hydrolase
MRSRVVFRVDSSFVIGTGHVMRCLTLADRLTLEGIECLFICRQFSGDIINHILSQGYFVHVLKHGNIISLESGTSNSLESGGDDGDLYSQWLGVSQDVDSAQCESFLSEINPDLLVVDSYSLDYQWELKVKKYCRFLLVIDDLANRRHACEILLDQNFGRVISDYYQLVSEKCQLLCGSDYALLRPEFSRLRTESLKKRDYIKCHKLLITMGGSDIDNATSSILLGLKENSKSSQLAITVVMGQSAVWVREVQNLAANLSLNIEIKFAVPNMAELMMQNDVAIGAAGSTSWERCCMGLPTFMVVLAENQKFIAQKLAFSGAGSILPYRSDNKAEFEINNTFFDLKRLRSMSEISAKIIDGQGLNRLSSIIIKKLGISV